jgi:hypothetical protein
MFIRVCKHDDGLYFEGTLVADHARPRKGFTSIANLIAVEALLERAEVALVERNTALVRRPPPLPAGTPTSDTRAGG